MNRSNLFNGDKVKIEILNRASQIMSSSYVSPSYMMEWLSDNLTDEVIERTVTVVIENKNHKFISLQPKTFGEFIENFNEKCNLISMKRIIEI